MTLGFYVFLNNIFCWDHLYLSKPLLDFVWQVGKSKSNFEKMNSLDFYVFIYTVVRGLEERKIERRRRSRVLRYMPLSLSYPP